MERVAVSAAQLLNISKMKAAWLLKIANITLLTTKKRKITDKEKAILNLFRKPGGSHRQVVDSLENICAYHVKKYHFRVTAFVAFQSLLISFTFLIVISLSI